MTQRLNLIAQKQMLHKYTDQLDKVLAKFKEDQLAVLNIAVTEWQTTPDFLQRSLERLVEGLSVLNSTKLKVEEELRDFTNKLEQNLEPADILAEYQEWVENPQQKILEAFEYSSILQARIDGFKAHIERSPFSFTTETTSDSTAPTVTKRLELPHNTYSNLQR
ncbi:hypothetical protein KIN20_011899 [Parelaphostrongylus tenuis]|uniref:Uncharacterized protein n=1 Tax=Parelaphostrongylus tenuis TaxID=148309 RepID=A0AAD5QLC9_PARTN|nr:hypothetical protein KIN20_011899 [Parelaphostrongylus tenuis]